MFFCEKCRVLRDWPQSFGGSYGKCEICGNENSCYDVPSKYLPIPELGTSPIYDPPKPEKDVHTGHCCQMHGCKYSDKDCTVKLHGGQEYMCNDCYDELYGEGGWEDAHFANEMYNRGRQRAWKDVVELSQSKWEIRGG